MCVSTVNVSVWVWVLLCWLLIASCMSGERVRTSFSSLFVTHTIQTSLLCVYTSFCRRHRRCRCRRRSKHNTTLTNDSTQHYRELMMNFFLPVSNELLWGSHSTSIVCRHFNLFSHFVFQYFVLRTFWIFHYLFHSTIRTVCTDRGPSHHHFVLSLSILPDCFILNIALWVFFSLFVLYIFVFICLQSSSTAITVNHWVHTGDLLLPRFAYAIAHSTNARKNINYCTFLRRAIVSVSRWQVICYTCIHMKKSVMHPAFVQQNVTFRRNRTLHTTIAVVAAFCVVTIALVSRSNGPLELHVWYLFFRSQVIIHTYGKALRMHFYLYCAINRNS